jgi:predicted RNA methylase
MSALGDYEVPVQRAIADNLDEGSICYDIGANVGFLSVFASRVGAGGKVFAFEPEPGNAASGTNPTQESAANGCTARLC